MRKRFSSKEHFLHDNMANALWKDVLVTHPHRGDEISNLQFVFVARGPKSKVTRTVAPRIVQLMVRILVVIGRSLGRKRKYRRGASVSEALISSFRSTGNENKFQFRNFVASTNVPWRYLFSWKIVFGTKQKSIFIRLLNKYPWMKIFSSRFTLNVCKYRNCFSAFLKYR
jgi:hypothetical protein